MAGAHRGTETAYAVRRILVPLLVICATSPEDGQQAIFSARSDLVLVDVAVERNRRVVAGLGQADFRLLDNGVPQEVTLVPAAELPLDVTLLVDVSSSVASRAGQLWRGVTAAASVMKPGHRLGLTMFAGSIDRALPLTATPVSLPAQPSVWPDLTSVIDALAHALIQPASPERRQVIVMFTDGEDTNSVTSPARLKDVAAKSSAFVYMVFFGRGGESVRPVLADIARESGGAVINSSNVETAFKQVLDLLATSYVLTYTPTGVSGVGWHEIQVSIVKPGRFDVRARRGYWAQ